MEAVDVLERIYSNFNEKKNSHIFLIETNEINTALMDIKNLIKRLLNTSFEVNTQIDSENYMELIIIRPEGNDIKKEQILTLQSRIKTKPILSNYIFYVIENAELLNESASNKLLKTLEEPNENIIGFLISNNINQILPTIKSRCEIDKLEYKKSNQMKNIQDDKLNEMVSNIIHIIETQTMLEYNLCINHNNEFKEIIKNSGKDLVNKIKQYYNQACGINTTDNINAKTVNIIIKNNTYKSIIKKCRYLNRTINKLSTNMNTELLLEKIYIELKEVNK